MTEKSIKWGYVLEAPGRISVAKQHEFLQSVGVEFDMYGSTWSDRLPKGSTRPRALLQERSYLLLGVNEGDQVFVADYYCLGASPADATWFVNELFARKVRLHIADKEIYPDGVAAVTDLVTRKQNTHHVRVSRGLDAAVLPGYRRPRGKKLKAVKVAKRPCVYRHYDADEKLLYVGACSNYEARMRSHKIEASWFPEISRAAVEFYPSMKAAVKAENAAIWFEKPKHNIRRLVPDPKSFVDAAANLVASSDPETAAKIRKLKTAI